VLKRIGMGKLGRLGLEPARRYERARPGELIHIDVKKLGRIDGGAGKRITGAHTRHRRRLTDAAGVRRGTTGWDAVHIAIDDATRLAYAEVLPDEKAATTVGFLRRALVFYARHGVTVERVLTDNGSPYVSTLHAIACRTHGVRHLRTRPYRPQTNGKACVLASSCRPVGRRGSPRPGGLTQAKGMLGWVGVSEPGWLRVPFPVP
jgi:transposase InsO family protein